MSLDQIMQSGLTDFVGGSTHLPALQWLQSLGEATRLMRLKSSKPFQTKSDLLIPTAALIGLDRAFKATQLLIQNNCALPLNAMPNEFVVTKETRFLFSKICQLIAQQLWFDISSVSQHPQKAAIVSTLEALWNEMRGYSVSADAENDTKSRDQLISTQRKENSRIVSRLLVNHNNINVTKISYFMPISGTTEQLEVKDVEKAIVTIKGRLINALQSLNPDKLFYIQWRVQKTLHGQYYINLLIYHDEQHSLQLPNDQTLLSQIIGKNQQHMVQLNLSNPLFHSIKIERDNFQGINLAQWKVIFNNMLYPLKYYYYQSKLISSKFAYIPY